MAVGDARGDGRSLQLALAGAGLGAVLLRFPFADGVASGWTWAAALAAAGLVGFPLLLGEAALGRFRRRNAVAAFGPGAWAGVGGLLALGALLAAALTAVVAGWAGRWAFDSFFSAWFDDPARQQRLIEAGPDALLVALAVLAVAVLGAIRVASRGRGAIVACAVASLLLLAGLAAYANTRPGSGEGRDALLSFDAAAFDESAVAAAALAGLLPALLATGATATLAMRHQDRELPRQAFLGVLFAAGGLALALLTVAGLAGAHGDLAGSEGLDVRSVPALLIAPGGAEGGVLLGTFSAALLLGAFALLAVLLEVPATWLSERFGSWTQTHGLLASGLAAYLVAAPFCFDASWAVRLDQLLTWVLAPLAGLLVSVRVGWTRPEVMDGYQVGEARHRLDRILKPVLRFPLPLLLLGLLLLGAMGFARAAGWADGSGGLWSWAP